MCLEDMRKYMSEERKRELEAWAKAFIEAKKNTVGTSGADGPPKPVMQGAAP